MKQSSKNIKGITLIALVITIIILLILAGISVAALSGENGLIKRAANAKENTEISQEKEQLEEEIYRSYNKKGILEIETLKSKMTNRLKVTHNNSNTFPLTVTFTATGNNYEINEEGNVEYIQVTDRTGITVGDLIDYEPDVASTTVYSHTTLDTYSGSTENTTDIVQNKLNWQVLRIYKDGSMDLIGSVTSQDISFKGILGYTNGVYLMDDICKTLYSRNANGIEARSVDIEDFEYWLEQSTEGTATRDNYKFSSGYSYGDTETYSSNNKYPPFYKTQINESDPGTLTTDSSYATDGDLTLKHTFYNLIFDNKNLSDGHKALSSRKIYWLGSRCIFLNSNIASFSLQRSNTESRWILFNSDGNSYSGKQCLRPVVHLKASVQITPSSNPTSTPHNITSY